MPGDVPVGRAAVESTNFAAVQELISERYAEHKPRTIGSTNDFVFRSSAAWAGELLVDHVTYGAMMAVNADLFDTLLIVSVLNGRFELSAGRIKGRAGRGGSLCLPNAGLYTMMDRATYQVVQFPSALVAMLGGRAGIDVADFRFEAAAPVSEDANRQWLATVAYLTRLLTHGREAISSILLTAATETAAAAALSVFPNTVMAASYVPGSGWTAPAVVRRAVAYIDDHAADPITVEDIAAAAGTGVRALQAAFRRHLNNTPTAYLRRVRLGRVHDELVAAQHGDGITVKDIALRWSFANAGRFSVEYRSTFGQPPSTTLRN